jgi:hypothetical protein
MVDRLRDSEPSGKIPAMTNTFWVAANIAKSPHTPRPRSLPQPAPRVLTFPHSTARQLDIPLGGVAFSPSTHHSTQSQSRLPNGYL